MTSRYIGVVFGAGLEELAVEELQKCLPSVKVLSAASWNVLICPAAIYRCIAVVFLREITSFSLFPWADAEVGTGVVVFESDAQIDRILDLRSFTGIAAYVGENTIPAEFIFEEQKKPTPAEEWVLKTSKSHL